MTKFKTLEELEKFKDTSMWCVCGRLMTGLHMQNCNKLHKQEQKLKTEDGIPPITKVMGILPTIL